MANAGSPFVRACCRRIQQEVLGSAGVQDAVKLHCPGVVPNHPLHIATMSLSASATVDFPAPTVPFRNTASTLWPLLPGEWELTMTKDGPTQCRFDVPDRMGGRV
jgi:hypothetical protein